MIPAESLPAAEWWREHEAESRARFEAIASEQDPPLRHPEVREPGLRAVDVMVWSASRPALLDQVVQSFQEQVTFTGRLRYYLCEDVLDPGTGLALDAIASARGFSGRRLGQLFRSYGRSMSDGLDRFATAPFVFHLEDDSIVTRPIPLDDVVDAMLAYPHLNQVTFGRRTLERHKQEGTERVERTLPMGGGREPAHVTSAQHWHFMSGLWRQSFIRPKWLGYQEHVHMKTGRVGGPLLPGLTERPSFDWYADVLGVVFWGHVGELAYFEHLGSGALSRRLERGGV